MRILLAFSLFVYLNLSGYERIPGTTDITTTQACDEIKGNLENPHPSSKYDSPGLIPFDEDSDFNESFINCTYTAANTEFRVNLIIPIFKINLHSPNLITFGTDNSPPIS